MLSLVTLYLRTQLGAISCTASQAFLIAAMVSKIASDAAVMSRFGLARKTYVTVHNGYDRDFTLSSSALATKCYPHFGSVLAQLKAAFPRPPDCPARGFDQRPARRGELQSHQQNKSSTGGRDPSSFNSPSG